MPIFKRCGRCKQRVAAGTNCPCAKRDYDRAYSRTRGDSKELVFYGSGPWKIARARAKDKCNGIDLYSLYVRNALEYGYTVHHIVPLKDDWSLRLDDNNLIYLTESNHRQLHVEMDKGEKERKAVIFLLRGLLEKHRG